MSRQLKAVKEPFIIGFICFAFSAIALGVIPFLQLLPDNSEKNIKYVIAGLFWLGLIIGITAVISAKRFMQSYEKQLISDGKYKKSDYPGIMSFSSDVKHIIIYMLCIVGIIIIISDIIWNYVSEYIMFPILSVVFFTFMMHCIVDGRNYKLFKAIKEGMDKV